METQTKDIPTMPLSLDLSQGRDEMNLAEFPLFALQNRASDVTELRYEDSFRDRLTGKIRHRRITFSGHPKIGLPTAADADILFGFMAYARQVNNFDSQKVYFDLPFFIEQMGLKPGGSSYQRVRLAAQRWDRTTAIYDGFWDKRQQKYLNDVHLGFLDGFHIAPNRGKSGDARTLSWFNFSLDFFQALNAGYIRKLDLETFFQLRSPIAKHMYRFLGKRFHHEDTLTFDLQRFAVGHMGLSSEHPVHQLKHKIKNAIQELEHLDLIEPMDLADRMPRVGKGQFTVTFTRGPAFCLTRDITARDQQPTLFEPELVQELVTRGITLHKARKLYEDDNFPNALIEEKIDLLDWYNEQGKSPDNTGGWLMAAIMEDYALPKGFKTRAEREAIKKRSEDKRKKLEERRQKQEEEKLNREREEEKRLEAKEQQRNRDWAKVEAHLSPLTPADREAVIDEALQLHENVFAKRGALKYRRDPEGHLIYEATYRDIVIQHLNLAAETSA